MHNKEAQYSFSKEFTDNKTYQSTTSGLSD